jgi:DNA primase
LQTEAITSEYSLLSLYGTNGLTEEISEAIKNLLELEDVIFMLDADEAGNKAVEKYSKELHELLPNIKISKAELPENEDVNSLLVGHEPEIISHILQERKFLFSPENPSNEKEKAKGNDPEARQEPSPSGSNSQLNTTNPDKIIYDTPILKIEIWGGIEYGNMHRLRLSLHMENKATNRSFRDDVNLYSNRSSKAFIQDASEELEIPQSQLKEIIGQFTREVEEYRLNQKANHKDMNKKEIVKLSLQEQKEALQILNSKNLVNHMKAAMLKVGLIGETENGLLLFLIFLTRYFETPLHALVHGSTGSGKTNLLKSILKLVPPESKYETTALTENVLFRPPFKDFWKNKILLIEDLDGSYKALLPLREFMTNQYISKLANDPNPKTGKYEQVTLEACGPIVIAGATTKDKVYEDNSNRSFLLHVNESKIHEDKVLDYQNKEAAGLIDIEGIQSVAKKIQDIQRMLNPNIKVINPFQPQLKLPEYVFTKKRTNTHYITLIKSITFLYQHQREKRKDGKGRIFIETTLQDVELANQLSKESLLRKSDELSGQVREFFERLKSTVQEEKKNTFLAKDIRGKLRMHPMKFNRYLNELKNRGYIKQEGGNRKLGYEYQITIWDDYQLLKQGLTVMDEILDKLWKKYPDGKYLH